MHSAKGIEHSVNNAAQPQPKETVNFKLMTQEVTPSLPSPLRGEGYGGAERSGK